MKVDIAFVTEPASLEKVRKELGYCRVISGDTETTGLDPYTSKPRTLQLFGSETSFVIDMFKVGYENTYNAIGDLLMDPKIVKVFHNWKFDLKMLNVHLGLPLNCPAVFDTMIASQLLNGGQTNLDRTRVKHDLDSISQRYLGVKIDKTQQTSNWAGTIYREQAVYAGLDNAILTPLYRLMVESIKSNNLEKVAHLEFSCVEATAHIELSGIYLDKNKWMEASDKFTAANKILERELWSILGNINLGSWQQVIKAFDERLNLKVSSTAADYLKAVAMGWAPVKNMFGELPKYDARRVIEKYIEYKQNAKKIGTYGEEYLKNINPVTGRIHSSFNQNGADTGRYTCSDPNLQQLPGLDEFRHSFMAPKGRKLITKDYSQIELRILAGIARIRKWINAFANGTDLHALAASESFKVPIDQVGDLRKKGKIQNFGSVYGMGPDSYMEKVNLESEDRITIDQAKRELRAFYNTIPEFEKVWLPAQERYLKQYGLVRSGSGRMRRLDKWSINDDELYIAKQAARNFPVQATNADILKTSLVKYMRAKSATSKICNIVHDEKLVEDDEDKIEYEYKVLNQCMKEAGEEYVDPEIEVKVDGKISDRWEK